MNAAEIPVFSFRDLKKVDLTPTTGAEKEVWHMTDGQKEMAVKVFFEWVDRSQEPVRRDREALKEFSCYEVLRNTPLSPFIPEPYGLVTDQDHKVVGFAVEWRNATELGKVNSKRAKRKVVNKEDFEFLKEALLRTEVQLDPDNISEDNLLFDPGPRRPQICLAECHVSQFSSREQYENIIRRNMQTLRDEYMREAR